jgi:hypothetical protein
VLPNACLHRGGVLIPSNLSHQLIEIAYSNRLSETSDGSDLIKDASDNHGWKSPYDYQRGVQETVFNRQPDGSYKKG